MAEYLSPGVYTESVSSGGGTIESLSSSVGGFIGFAKKGTVGKSVLINSWQGFLDEFAGGGLKSAFDENQYLAYAVYGFFQNGGGNCYVSRVCGEGAVEASVAESTMHLTFSAKNAGLWGNGLKIVFTENTDKGEGHFKVSVMSGKEVLESYYDVTAEDIIDTFVQNSSLINVSVNSSDEVVLSAKTLILKGGNDGDEVSVLTTDMLQIAFDEVNDVSMICSPDFTTLADSNSLLAYCTDRKILAVTQAEGSENIAGIKEFRSNHNAGDGGLYYPYIEVNNPLSKVGDTKKVPPCGHLMGMFAKNIINRGVHKNPAGVEYPLVGVVKVCDISPTQKSLRKLDVDVLNPLGINCIMPRPNYGICVWGCRSLSSDSTLKYVADIMLKSNVMKSLEAGTQSLVFEPNDKVTRDKAVFMCSSFLETMYNGGAFLGEDSSEAYYVKCDETNNPKVSRDLGRLIIECGYAQKKPSEFVVIKIAHQMQEQ